ncbi:hypothetical protein GPECTOR_1g236 [Gonium pectorale]|uniref:Uncharacterized protein n=1 Tax=Gonium pectorale TaxID=33097 RepID=A0A150H3Z8_GONPE|nr:hypothetical protein GPECTOR_1g236 [Gonium pectorale]|eukprot:KXZ56270.1 hypothetical protein GPECTOR_1g236 [Gonium pectorale]
MSHLGALKRLEELTVNSGFAAGALRSLLLALPPSVRNVHLPRAPLPSHGSHIPFLSPARHANVRLRLETGRVNAIEVPTLALEDLPYLLEKTLAPTLEPALQRIALDTVTLSEDEIDHAAGSRGSWPPSDLASLRKLLAPGGGRFEVAAVRAYFYVPPRLVEQAACLFAAGSGTKLLLGFADAENLYLSVRLYGMSPNGLDEQPAPAAAEAAAAEAAAAEAAAVASEAAPSGEALGAESGDSATAAQPPDAARLRSPLPAPYAPCLIDMAVGRLVAAGLADSGAARDANDRCGSGGSGVGPVGLRAEAAAPAAQPERRPPLLVLRCLARDGSALAGPDVEAARERLARLVRLSMEAAALSAGVTPQSACRYLYLPPGRTSVAAVVHCRALAQARVAAAAARLVIDGEGAAAAAAPASAVGEAAVRPVSVGMATGTVGWRS